MKISEFEKYKKLVESSDPSLLQGNTEAMKVYAWMEETGRLDEGFWGSIWSWLKKNFSPTARKLYKLADEYKDELSKELEAEFAKIDTKEMAARMRSSWAGRLSDDIRERMDIVAGDDEDYRELARHLINKRTLEAKKANLHYLDRVDAQQLKGELDRKIDDAESSINSIVKKMTREDRSKVEDIRKALSQEIGKHRRILDLEFKTDSQRKELVETLSNYTLLAFTKFKRPLDNKTAIKYLEEMVKVATDEGKRLRTGSITAEEATAAILEMFMKVMNKKEFEFSTVKSEAVKRAKSKLEGKNDEDEDESDSGDVSSEVSTDQTEEILASKTVNKAVDQAVEDTGKKDPTPQEIVDEMRSYVKDYFNKNLKTFVEDLVEKVQDFNKKTPEQKKAASENFEFKLDDKGNLKVPTSEDVKGIMEDFVKIAGLVVPYFKAKNTSRDAVESYLFQIYAITKSGDNSLKPEDVSKIVDNLKSKASGTL